MIAPSFSLQKSNKRKLASYIYYVTNEDGHKVAGFNQVGVVVQHFYQRLLGP